MLFILLGSIVAVLHSKLPWRMWKALLGPGLVCGRGTLDKKWVSLRVINTFGPWAIFGLVRKASAAKHVRAAKAFIGNCEPTFGNTAPRRAAPCARNRCALGIRTVQYGRSAVLYRSSSKPMLTCLSIESECMSNALPSAPLRFRSCR